MLRTIKIVDTTLREGECSPGCSINLAEKVEMALQLEKLGVDGIEAGFANASSHEFTAVKQIASQIKHTTVASLVRTQIKDIDRAKEALLGAQYPRIHICIPTSEAWMREKLNKTPEEVLELAMVMVKYAKAFCSDIEFSAEDATRSNLGFLYRVFETAIKAGATVVNIPDTVGLASPMEFQKIIMGVRENVSNIHKAEISVHAHNDLGLAVANSLAAIQAGVAQIECTVNGIGERAGNAALEEVVMNLYTRKDIYDAGFNVKTKEIYRTSKLLSTISGMRVQSNKAVVGENALSCKEDYDQIIMPEAIGLTENNSVLSKHSGKRVFCERLNAMGYELEAADLNKAFDEFKILAYKKKVVTNRDLAALMVRKRVKVPETYKLDRFVITSGNTITTTSSVRLLCKTGAVLEEVMASYDGPIDASYKAIEKLVGKKFTLENFVITSVTGGTDAQGEVNVKIKINDKIYNGHGISIDIVEASILAYISAINNMLYDVETQKKV